MSAVILYSVSYKPSLECWQNGVQMCNMPYSLNKDCVILCISFIFHVIFFQLYLWTLALFGQKVLASKWQNMRNRWSIINYTKSSSSEKHAIKYTWGESLMLFHPFFYIVNFKQIVTKILSLFRGDCRCGMDWWMDLLATCTHHSDLQVITLLWLISTLTKH
jgi:hypothetical protein